jgi:RNase adapter protein RapZ
MRIILITGISGSGKSVALNALEDAGYYCVDNLPSRFLPDLADFLASDGNDRLAVAIDARSGSSLSDLPFMIAGLKAKHEVHLLFLTSSTQALIQRFSETRRRHPLSGLRKKTGEPGSEPDDSHASLADAIEYERELVSGLVEFGHQIDTSNLRANTLRAWVKKFVEHEHGGLTLMFESFGFKRGLPLDADLVFDVRTLPNPFYDHALRPLTGLDQPVINFLAEQPDVREMIEDLSAYVHKWLPRFRDDNRSYLTVAIGCTGGQHRSVYIAETLGARFAQEADVLVRHREIAPPQAPATTVSAHPGAG